jgi:RNA polymerase sigma-70 factor (ECF subfamily)
MQTTHLSLLENLRAERQEVSKAAWARFADLYTPLLYSWACRLGLQQSDAADLVQDVFVLLVRKLPAFRHDGQRSFRGWLHTVLLNQWRDRRVRAPALALDAALVQAGDPGPAELLEESEYRHYLVSRALQLMQADFQPATWKACWETVVNGRPAAEVAAELSMTPAAVYAATSRVLRRLRQELEGLLE